jgi:hypothetical protein
MKDVGMVADQAHLAKYAEAEGFRPMHMREAIAALETVYGQAPVQVGVTDVDWERMLAFFSAMARTNYLAHFHGRPGSGRPSDRERRDVPGETAGPHRERRPAQSPPAPPGGARGADHQDDRFTRESRR